MRSQCRSRLTRRDFLHRTAGSAVAGVMTATLLDLAIDRSSFAAEGDKAAANPAAARWPDFRNGVDLRGLAAGPLSATPTLKWERPTEDGCKSTPAIVDGRAYLATLSGELLCLNLADGALQWTYKSLVATDPKTFIPGFSSPVTVSGDVVLCGDEEGGLHCVERATGAARWKFDAGGLIVGGATVRGDRVLCGSHSQFLYSVDLKTGEKHWEFDAQGPINGTQAFDGEFTFVTGCSEPVLYVVDTRTGKQETQIKLDDLLIATPALVDGILYFGTSEGQVMAVDWKAGKTVWAFQTRQPREVHSAPAVTADRVIIGARDKSVYCLDRKSGQQQWTFSTRAGNDSSPVVVGDRAYIGSGDKFLYGLELTTGRELWKYSAGVSFADSSPAVAGGRMLACTEGPQGRILCFG